ncbi:MAG: tyrosine-protein kinase domain-containing protein [Anaerolineae bacterium]
MQIRDYIGVLVRRKWVAIVVALVTVAIVAVGTLTMTPTYNAATVIRVAQSQDSMVNYDSLQHAQRVMNTYVYLLQSRAFLDIASQRLGAGMSPDQLAAAVEIELMSDTELLRITATHANPVVAANIANVLANLLVSQGRQIYTGPGRSAFDIVEEELAIAEDNLRADRLRLQMLLEEDAAAARTEEIQELNARIGAQEQTVATLLERRGTARLRESLLANSVSIVEPAAVPGNPSSPRTSLNLALGTLIGIVAGVALAFVLDNVDPTLYTASDVARSAGVPIVGVVPALSLRRQQRNHAFLLNPDGSGPAHEAFRSVMHSLLSTTAGSPKALLVTSAEPAAGRSTVVANLAVTIGKTGRRVIVVDGDLRQPSLHQVLSVSNTVGLATLLLDPSAIGDANRLGSTLQQTRLAGVQVLTSGPVSQHSADMLGSIEMARIVAHLCRQADIVLLDSPAMLSAADAVGLAEVVDQVLLVAAAAEATDTSLKNALVQLNRVRARVVGVLLNKADRADNTFVYFQQPRLAPTMVDMRRIGPRPEEIPSVARDSPITH